MEVTPWAAMGPSPHESRYIPWRTEVPTLRCPSDPGKGLPSYGRTNYAACLGDGVSYTTSGPGGWHGGMMVWRDQQDTGTQPWTTVSGRTQYTRAGCRGVFIPRLDSQFRNILDGLANTIMCGEIPTDLGDLDKRTTPVRTGSHNNATTSPLGNPSACQDLNYVDPERPQFWIPGAANSGNINPTNGMAGRSQFGRGYRWAVAVPAQTGFLTILPPNRELCNAYNEHSESTAPAGSRHQGGAHVLMADGAVKFVTDSIEAGDSRARSIFLNNTPGNKSPYGLWGALGSRGAKEVIEEDL